MPELPEVETVMRGLSPLLIDRVISVVELRAPSLRSPLPKTIAKRLQGQRFISLRRRAKYILADLSGGDTLLIHLGMTGGFFIRNKNQLETHDHMVFHLDNGQVIAYHDPRRFGQIEIIPAGTTHKAIASLGPEPLNPDFTPNILAAAITNKKTHIKAALLDQSIVAGIGNIYASEALFHACIHPERQAGTLKKPEISKLTQSIKDVLMASIKAGGSTLRDYRTPNGELGFFQDQFAVYGREGEKCPDCNCRNGINRITQNGRSTFFCSKKQR